MIICRDGSTLNEDTTQDMILEKLYTSCTGRMFMKVMSIPLFSNIACWVLTKRASKVLISPFIKKYQINMDQYEAVSYDNFDQFFSRNKKAENRQIDETSHHLISPCDGKLTVYPLSENAHFDIKQSSYTLSTLLKDESLAKKYTNGYALVFRLTVDNFHRYCYETDGSQEQTVRIPGILHSVNPIVNDYVPVYKENTREYCICQTEHFKEMIVMEVGALMIGRIVNHMKSGAFRKGQEKGYFRFGGSTIVLLFQENTLKMDDDILHNSTHGLETEVRFGEKIGMKKNN